jgi:hypothetical protein
MTYTIREIEQMLELPEILFYMGINSNVDERILIVKKEQPLEFETATDILNARGR